MGERTSGNKHICRAFELGLKRMTASSAAAAWKEVFTLYGDGDGIWSSRLERREWQLGAGLIALHVGTLEESHTTPHIT
jgi:hypothetical protein